MKTHTVVTYSHIRDCRHTVKKSFANPGDARDMLELLAKDKTPAAILFEDSDIAGSQVKTCQNYPNPYCLSTTKNQLIGWI